MKATHLEAL